MSIRFATAPPWISPWVAVLLYVVLNSGMLTFLTWQAYWFQKKPDLLEIAIGLTLVFIISTSMTIWKFRRIRRSRKLSAH